MIIIGGDNMVFQDLTGQKFGMLTVRYQVDDYIKPDGRKVSRWYCDCDCGGHKEASMEYLKRNKIPPSCGCLSHKNRVEKNRESFLGHKFGRLTIIEENFETHPTTATCLCDCGSYTTAVRADIICGHTQSCGCLQRDKASETNTKDWAGVISDYGVEFLQPECMNDKGQWLWKCKCGVCGNEFIALPAKINNGHITSCGCSLQSSGERYILSTLDEIGVKHREQFIFSDCKYKYVLRFDFAIFDGDKLLYLIEYDGEQHFRPVDFWGGEEGFKNTKARDEVKNKYCKLHNIPLLRIPYTLSNDEIKQQIYEYHLSLTTAGCA